MINVTRTMLEINRRRRRRVGIGGGRRRHPRPGPGPVMAVVAHALEFLYSFSYYGGSCFAFNKQQVAI